MTSEGSTSSLASSSTALDTSSSFLDTSSSFLDSSTPPPSYQQLLQQGMLEREEEGEESKEEGGEEKEAAQGKVIVYKSSKALYRAIAAQWGITCKMSDHCRCYDCQGRYFDCDYEHNEHDKTDGGLGAGSPMFISEVMHGTACAIL